MSWDVALRFVSSPTVPARATTTTGGAIRRGKRSKRTAAPYDLLHRLPYAIEAPFNSYAKQHLSCPIDIHEHLHSIRQAMSTHLLTPLRARDHPDCPADLMPA
jgi:hypothetical protein